MKNILLLAIAALTLMASCQKEEACESTNVGYLAVENKTTWVINFEVANQQHQLQPGETKTVTAFAGTYSFDATAVTTPAVEWNLDFIVNQCHTLPVKLDY